MIEKSKKMIESKKFKIFLIVCLLLGFSALVWGLKKQICIQSNYKVCISMDEKEVTLVKSKHLRMLHQRENNEFWERSSEENKKNNNQGLENK